MDLLASTPAPGRRLRSRWWLLLAAASAAGCAVFSALGGGAAGPAFPHDRHAQEGMECGDCHTDWESSDVPGMPPRSACNLCHEGIDADKPPEKRIDVLFDGDTLRRHRVNALADEVIFSHQRHANAGLECTTCHVGIDQASRVEQSPALDMDDCTACHAQKQQPNDCATCHQQIRADVAPRTHAQHWLRLHGKTARAHSDARVDDCSMCHTETTCVTCHRDTPPENHDNYFRQRSHGLFARMDRDNCAACHRSDSCDACHRDTRPRNHVGVFGGVTSNHCVSCHFPLQDNDCFTCHKGTPSHAAATPLPPGHNAGMNCRMCHGNGQPLPHVDKGDACTVCHR